MPKLPAPRYRTKHSTTAHYIIDNHTGERLGGRDDYPSVVSHFSESAYPGSNDCEHVIYSSSNGKAIFRDTSLIVARHCTIPDLDYLASLREVSIDSLNWDKLPTSSKAGLIQTLAELDETALMFTKQFWNKLNYGSVEFGIMPFIADIRNMAEVFSNVLKNGVDSFPYEDQNDVPLPSHSVRQGSKVTTYEPLRLRVRYSGEGSISFLTGDPFDRLLILFDVLGVHPDAATFWDLVPLSFLIDYVVPIGDFLETFRSGWVNSMVFEGWMTMRGQFESKSLWDNQLNGPLVNTPAIYFSRKYVRKVLSVPPMLWRSEPEWLKMPSVKQMFNQAFVLGPGLLKGLSGANKRKINLGKVSKQVEKILSSRRA